MTKFTRLIFLIVCCILPIKGSCEEEPFPKEILSLDETKTLIEVKHLPTAKQQYKEVSNGISASPTDNYGNKTQKNNTLLAQEPLEGVHFVVIIPSYNNAKWVRKNLESVAKQTYKNWSLIYINDASQDSTGTLAPHYIKEYNLDTRALYINNKTRKGALANLYNAIHRCKADSVIVCLDGDDWLSNEHVLSHLASVYADKNVWMTYGSFITQPAGWRGRTAEPLPSKIVKKNAFRQYKWVTSALRTFYAKLFHLINKNDLMRNGQFYPAAWDLAMMFPMLEMSSKGHIRHIKKTLYIYNIVNPISDFRANRQIQLDNDRYIRKKKTYKPLKTLFG